ncbi:MAG: tRNA uridine-5-carboxymethylaminomethyl(34) synthesis GTPase MnmE [Clostridiales Family XIII bacterium]|jgi:tRNA modification GTPase|nr:tRNA uridine-5-carboxymethylaminomethyl(34) synthesis GTPase MnmE [Clostridiales Family XIII bacterium]
MSGTIAAVSTAYGEGGIGIVRMSGARAGEILGGIFRARADTAPATAFQDRHLYYGHIVEPASGETIDEVLAVFMRSPHTYTGEDVAEIHCHGSVVSLRRILGLCCTRGAVLAPAGEFTKRAFLNGRIDLAQAEAVIDVVRARTDEGARAALWQLGGRLSAEVSSLRGQLADVVAQAIVLMDYPDEDENPADVRSVAHSISVALGKTSAQLDALIQTAESGRMVREGLNVVIAGKANTGKSSLLNALLRENRAIVTDMPGTTRDSIEAYLDLRGIPVRLTDTAGIRDADGEAERIGIDRAKALVSDADLVILLLDGSRALDVDDRDALAHVHGRRMLVCVNKWDLPHAFTAEDLRRFLGDGIADGEESSAGDANDANNAFGKGIHILSALEGTGIDTLEDYLVSMVYGGNLRQGESLLVTNMRHRELLLRAKDEVDDAARALTLQGTPDFAEMGARTAWELLGEITGETATEDILDRVFEQFCVGK